MACFIAPLVEAIAVTYLRKSNPGNKYLPDLEKMLWGGTLMLIVDHIINGELTWRFPFITSLGYSGGWGIVLKEILTVGVPMALVLTLAWGVWVMLKEKKILRFAQNDK